MKNNDNIYKHSKTYAHNFYKIISLKKTKIFQKIR